MKVFAKVNNKILLFLFNLYLTRISAAEIKKTSFSMESWPRQKAETEVFKNKQKAKKDNIL